MGWLDFIDPIMGAMSGGGGSKSAPHPIRIPGNRSTISPRLTLPRAHPDWDPNTAKPIPSPTLHGWSANSLGSYLKSFQIGQGTAPGVTGATDSQLFPAPSNAPLTPVQQQMDPQALAKDLMGKEAPTPGVVPALVASSTGGALSPGAAALYGRMLGGVPSPAESGANALNAPATIAKPPMPYQQFVVERGGGGPRPYVLNPGQRQSAWMNDPRDQRHMSPAQRLASQQGAATYNQTQAPGPVLG